MAKSARIPQVQPSDSGAELARTLNAALVEIFSRLDQLEDRIANLERQAGASNMRFIPPIRR